MIVRRISCSLAIGGLLTASVVTGCGQSESKYELTPEAKKSIVASKVGDPSKFVTPGKRSSGKRK